MGGVARGGREAAAFAALHDALPALLLRAPGRARSKERLRGRANLAGVREKIGDLGFRHRESRNVGAVEAEC